MFGKKSRSHSIGQEEFTEKAGKGASIIDVRSPQEFREGSLKNAQNIPLNRLGEHLDEIRDQAAKNETVLLYCHSGARSKMARVFLEKQGLAGSIYDLKGGISGWKGDPTKL